MEITDNTIYRMNFAVSRAQARQMVSHAYFLINGKSVNIPSMCVSVNDVITTKDKKGIQNLIRHNLTVNQGARGLWLSIDNEALSATVTVLPSLMLALLSVMEAMVPSTVLPTGYFPSISS